MISEAFTVAPEVVYSPTDPAGKEKEFTTNRFPPDTATSVGLFKPETSEAFTVAPEVVYSPIVPVRCRRQPRSRKAPADINAVPSSASVLGSGVGTVIAVLRA